MSSATAAAGQETGSNWQVWTGAAVAAAVVAGPALASMGKEYIQSAALQHVATTAKPNKLALLALKTMNKPIEPFNTYEGKLPPLPVPALADTAERYLISIKALCKNEAEYANAAEKVREFFSSDVAAKLQDVLLQRAQASKNWLADWWLNFAYLMGRDPLPINVSFCCHGCYRTERPTTNMALRAAGFVFCALDFRRRVIEGDVPVLKAGGVVPVDMKGYTQLFGTCRLPGEQQDTLVTNPAKLSEPAHVVLCIGTTLWKVQVQGPGWSASVQDMYAAFQQALEATAAQPGGPFSEPPVALLTSDARSRWARARAVLQQHPVNARSLAAVEDALLWLNLHCGNDGDAVQLGPMSSATPPSALHEGAHISHAELNTERPVMNIAVKQWWHDMGDGRRTWWDKSIALNFLPSGHIGTTVEHTFADAPVPAHLWEHMMVQEVRLAGAAYADVTAQEAAGQRVVLGGSNPGAPARLAWDIPGWSAEEHGTSMRPPVFRLVRSASLGWTGVGESGVGDAEQAWRSGEWDVISEAAGDAARGKAQWRAPDADADAAAADAEEDKLPSAPEHLVAWMAGARRRYDALVAQVHMRSVIFDRWGKNAMKKWRVSPDAFMQQALQIASLALYGRTVLTYESASTRAFEGGRTETIRSASAPAAAMAQAVLTAVAAKGGDALLQAHADGPVPADEMAAAVAALGANCAWEAPAGATPLDAPAIAALVRRSASAHSALTRAAMRGEGVDRHVLGLKLAALTTGTKLPAFFSDPETHAGDSYELSTSQSPLAQELLVKGSATYKPDLKWEVELGQGGGFGPTANPGVGVSYHIMPGGVYFHVSARGATPALQCVQMEECLLSAMLVLGGVFQAAAAAPSA